MNPHLPTIAWCVWVFLLGLGVGSFINVLVARLPYQKSVIWPGSRCFSCLQPLRLRDNIPLIGYLWLGGRCRYCGARFSSRYFWVELGTGVGFLLLFAVSVLSHARGGPGFLQPWQNSPGLAYSYYGSVGPPLESWLYFIQLACLLSLLIAAALIDAEHGIIPLQITYFGTVLGIVFSTLFPWPWPNDLTLVNEIANPLQWRLPETFDKVTVGVVIWPFAGPPPEWAPPGSWQLGLMNSLIGALAGQFVARGIKFLFEVGFGREALGLGDADLLMMIGAFLGWQVAVLAMPVGAFVTLPIILGALLWMKIHRRGITSGMPMPFGPGIAIGAVVTWLAWPRVGELVRIWYDPLILGLTLVIVTGGTLIAGLILRRGR